MTFLLKKQYQGWGGFVTQKIKPCRLIARMIALIYNWWSLFVRLAEPDKHFEAIVSRPLLLHGIGKQTTHAAQKNLNHYQYTRQSCVCESGLSKG